MPTREGMRRARQAAGYWGDVPRHATADKIAARARCPDCGRAWVSEDANDACRCQAGGGG